MDTVIIYATFARSNKQRLMQDDAYCVILIANLNATTECCIVNKCHDKFVSNFKLIPLFFLFSLYVFVA